MPLLPLGEFEASGDLTTGYNIGVPGSASQQAVDLRVEPAAAAYLATAPAVVDAVVDAVGPAVDEAIVDADLVRGSDTSRVPRVEEAQFLVANKDGGVPFHVTNSDTFIGSTRIEPSSDIDIRSANNGQLFYINPISGEVYAPNLRVDALNGAPYGTGGARRVVLLAGLGQSNMEGRGRPFGAEYDPTDSRIMMWDWPTGSLQTATVPLSSQQQQTGLSILTVIAREIVRTEPSGTIVVIVNCGVGDTGLVEDKTNGVWSPAYVGANPHLLPTALDALDAAITAVGDRFGMAPVLRGFWHQGEADEDTPQGDYENALDALIAEVRAHLGDADMPFVLGSMVPEWVGNDAGRLGIRAALEDTPRRAERVAWVDGVSNGGGSASPTDIVHYRRDGVITHGTDMHAAVPRALNNTVSSVPAPPLAVTARIVGTQLTASWSPPQSRFTAFTAQHRPVGGSTWTAFTTTGIALSATATVTPGAYEVRVSTTNETGTSAYTTPTIGA